MISRSLPWIVIGLLQTLSARAAHAQSVFGELDGDCAEAGFPRFMAFRAFDSVNTNYPYWWNAGPALVRGSGQADAIQDWPCVEVAVDRNGVELEVLEQESSHAIPTYLHSAWGTISNNWLSSNLGSLEIATPAIDVEPQMWLYEAGGVVTITGDINACVIETDGTTGARLTEDLEDDELWDVVVYPAEFSGVAPLAGHDWEDARHYRIEGYSVDGGTGDYTFEVDVGTYSGQADFCDDLSTGEQILWLATHARMDHSSNQIAWAVNLSYGIEDSYGVTGSELMTEIILARWNDFGFTSGYEPDGIQLDMARWRPDQGGVQRHPIDADNDGHPDYGFVQGAQLYGVGGVLHVWDFDGTDKEVIPDSSAPWWGYRGNWGVLGIEIENFPESAEKSTGGYYPNSWTAFSSAFHHLRMAIKDATVEDPLSYALTKAETTVYNDCVYPEVTCSSSCGPCSNDVFRVGLAADTLMGMPHGYSVGPGEFHLSSWPQYFGGGAASWGWLGDPISPASRAEDPSTGTNLFGSGYDDGDWTLYMGDCDQDPSWDWEAAFATLDTPDDTIEVTVDTVCNVPRIDDIQLRLDFPNATIGSTEQSYTLKFEVKVDPTTSYPGLDFWTDVDALEALGTMPRLIRVRLVLTPSRGYEQDILIPKDSEWHTIFLTFQDVVPPSSPGALDKVRLYLGEEIGTVTVKNVGLYEGSGDIWQREFDGGWVLLNMSDEAYEYTLSCADDLVEVIDGDTSPDADGDGSTITSTAGVCEVTVPEHDAAFLRYDTP